MWDIWLNCSSKHKNWVKLHMSITEDCRHTNYSAIAAAASHQLSYIATAQIMHKKITRPKFIFRFIRQMQKWCSTHLDLELVFLWTSVEVMLWTILNQLNRNQSSCSTFDMFLHQLLATLNDIFTDKRPHNSKDQLAQNSRFLGHGAILWSCHLKMWHQSSLNLLVCL